MKKSMTSTAQRRLVLRREHVAQLTILELRHPAGGRGPVEDCSRFAPGSCNPPTEENLF